MTASKHCYIRLFRAFLFPQRKSTSLQPIRSKADNRLTQFCKIIHLRIIGIYALREACIHDVIVSVDCKEIGLYSGRNERKSGFGQVRVTYLKAKWAGTESIQMVLEHGR